eukprot:scaffold2705_cov109-Isochrysis_galbana.AAC.16
MAIKPKYPACPAEKLESELTIVVSVKDACSQARALPSNFLCLCPPFLWCSANRNSCCLHVAFARAQPRLHLFRGQGSILFPTEGWEGDPAPTPLTQPRSWSVVGSGAKVAHSFLTNPYAIPAHPSQAPGFIRSLETFAPPGVHIIYTFPNFESCARIDLKKVLARWKRVTVLPLPIRASPMQVCGGARAGEIGPIGTGRRGRCARWEGHEGWVGGRVWWRGKTGCGGQV